MFTYRTALRSYFGSVIDSMKRQGFDLLSWVTMNSAKNTYFTDAFAFAQESRLFFVPRGPKALIVMLTLREHFGRRLTTKTGEIWDYTYYQGYWSGLISFSYDHKQAFQDYLSDLLHEEIFSEVNRDWDIPIAAGFRGSLFEARKSHCFNGVVQVNLQPLTLASSQEDLAGAEVLTRPFGEILKRIYPYLYRRFRELQVTDFAPHYTFPKQERDFWKKFPTQRLRDIAPHLVGVDFSKPATKPRQ